MSPVRQSPAKAPYRTDDHVPADQGRPECKKTEARSHRQRAIPSDQTTKANNTTPSFASFSAGIPTPTERVIYNTVTPVNVSGPTRGDPRDAGAQIRRPGAVCVVVDKDPRAGHCGAWTFTTAGAAG